MTTIRVKFERKVLDAIHHDVHINNTVIRKLTAEGIPVEGGLWLRSVKHGRLCVFNEGPRIVYEWTPGSDSPDEDDEL